MSDAQTVTPILGLFGENGLPMMDCKGQHSYNKTTTADMLW